MLLTKNSTNLPNQASQAAGFVRLIRPLAVRLPLEGAAQLSGNQAGAWFVLLDRTGSYSRSYSYFSLAPVPPSFLQARLWGGNRGDEALQKRARFISSSFFFVSRFLAVGKNLKTKALYSACPFPSCFLRPLSPRFKVATHATPLYRCGFPAIFEMPQAVSVALSNRAPSLYSCGWWRCGVFLDTL